MDRASVIRLAIQAKALSPAYAEQMNYIDQLERFAALVAAAEREACAKICERLAEKWRFASGDHSAESAAMAGAETVIRARGETGKT